MKVAASLLLALLLSTPSLFAQTGKPEPQAPPAPAVQPREPLAVMTFNIRYGTAKDGENEWSARRDMLFEVIREPTRISIGLQEALEFQIDEILAAVRGYAVVGVGRDDGGEKGEYSAILFRTERFHVAEAGTFWFSDTPTVPARSRGATRSRGSGRGPASSTVTAAGSITSTCTSITSRSRRAKRAPSCCGGGSMPERCADPVIVTGDFNVGETNPALSSLTGGGRRRRSSTRIRVLHADDKDAGTFSNFKFGLHGADKIDYVLVQPGTEVMAAEIVRISRNNRYPSDHFPVTARVRLR